MSHPVIPVPLRFDGGEGEFAFRSGTAVTYADVSLAPVVERFCSQVTRRTGLRLAPAAGGAVAGEPSVTIECGPRDELGALPAAAGLSPAGRDHPDERYSLRIDADRVAVRAAEPAGVMRGLTTLVQLVAAAPGAGGGEICVPGARILDAPRYAWRGLSLDVARTFFTAGEIRRVIDLLELYKLNVLHLHLTDDQGWRLPVGRPAGRAESETAGYSDEDLRALVAYAGDRFVTIVPEVDTPGHASAFMRLHPDLNTGRNQVEWELPPGRKRRAVWLDPELPATFELIGDVLAYVAATFPSPYFHFGGDEPYGMPHDLYRTYVERLRRLVRSLGKWPLGWQTVAGSFGWEPAEALGPGRRAQVAGVEAAIWAETITGFDDLSFLLLPRLPGIAHKAWSDPKHASWTSHRDRLAQHGRLWAQDGLTYFRASTVDWPSATSQPV